MHFAFNTKLETWKPETWGLLLLWCFNWLERSLTSTERVWHLYGPISQLSAKPLWNSKGGKKCMALHWIKIRNIWPSPIFLQGYPLLKIYLSLKVSTSVPKWFKCLKNPAIPSQNILLIGKETNPRWETETTALGWLLVQWLTPALREAMCPEAISQHTIEGLEG